MGHIGRMPQGSPLVDVDHALGRVLCFVEDVVDPIVDAGLEPVPEDFFLELGISVVKFGPSFVTKPVMPDCSTL